MAHVFTYTVRQRNDTGSSSWTFISLDELPDSVTVRQIQKLAKIARPRFTYWWVWGGYHCGVSIDQEHASRSLRSIAHKAHSGAWPYMRTHLNDIKGAVGRIAQVIDVDFEDGFALSTGLELPTDFEPALLGAREDLSNG